MNNKILLLTGLIITQISCKNQVETTIIDEEGETSSGSIFLTETQYQNLAPQLTDMQSIPFSSEIEATGMVDVPPENIAIVSSAVSGIVKTITHNVLPGKYVRQGAVLAVAHSMELVQLQQDYLETYLKKEVLNQEYQRQKSLVDNGAGVERKLQEADSNLKLNKARIAGLGAKLRIVNVNLEQLQNGEIRPQLYIYAPIAGYVKEVNINTGTNFSGGEKLFELISKEHLHVELQIFEKDAALLKEHQKVHFSGQGITESIVGSIFLIAKSFEEESRAIDVHVHLDEERFEENLIPGQYLKSRIQIDERATNALPESAIIREENGNYVLVQNNGTDGVSFEKVSVETGTSKEGMIEIKSPASLKNVVISEVHLISGMQAEE